VNDDLIIEGSPEDLEALRELLEAEFGADAAVQPVTSAQSGELREPIITALIVGLGGPVLTKAVASVIRRYLQHRERMAEIGNERRAAELDHEFRMALVGADDRERAVTLEQLETSDA
jgi:hypothetical protein